MLTGGLLAGALTPAYSQGARDALDQAASAVLRDRSGVVVGRATLSPRADATLLTIAMRPGRAAVYAVGAAPTCAGSPAAVAGRTWAVLTVDAWGSATLEAAPATAGAALEPGDALLLIAADGGSAACGVFQPQS